MGFVHNHPEQLNRVRRFREYYLPTTRKLLDTAQGLGDTDSANAAEIRRDITGILHTLNQAYEKLYDTLLQDVSMDVSTEIDTLEAMLRQDGLTHDLKLILTQGAKLYELPCVATEKGGPPRRKPRWTGAGCGVLLRRVLAARGCTDPAAAQALLGQGEPLSDPFLLTDMDKACRPYPGGHRK